MTRLSIKKLFVFFAGAIVVGGAFVITGHYVLALTTVPGGNNGGGTAGNNISVQILVNGASNLSAGSVIGSRIDCGEGSNICGGSIPTGATSVTFTETPASGYIFNSWGGDCNNTTGNTCTVSWGQDPTPTSINVIANFVSSPVPSPVSSALSVQVTVGGSVNNSAGVVSSTAASAGVPPIKCGGNSTNCSTSLKFPPSQRITLTASPAGGYTFSGWSFSGAAVDTNCPATDLTCMVANDGWTTAGTVSANFTKITPAFAGNITANIVYASTTGGTATVYLSWPAAKNAPGVTYAISRGSTPVGSTASTSYYDTSAPLGNSATVYSITVSGISGSMTSNSLDLNLQKVLTGYAWANANASTVSGSTVTTKSTKSYNWNSASTPFDVSGSASSNSITLSFSEPASGSSNWSQDPSADEAVYRCPDSGYTLNCKNVSQSLNVNPGGTWSFTDSNLVFASTYYYEVATHDQYGSMYIVYLAATTNSAANYQGIGWIKFSSDTTSSPSDTNQYGVYIDDKGNLSGYAWSGMQCPSGQSGNCGYGWLSFNESDASHQRGSFTGAGLTDWARFLTFANGGSSWDGWVNLGGVSYDPSTKMFGGRTPTLPVDVLGQMSFCDPNNGANYCVRGTPPPQPPIIKPVSAVTYNSFTVNWTNPQKYTKIEVYVSKPNNSTDFSSPPADQPVFATTSQSYVNATTSILSVPVNALPNMQYGMFVRGYLK